MAVNIEVKQLIKDLRERVTALEIRLQTLEAKQTVPSVTLKEPKKCPHCGIAPAYFFHVKACKKQKEEKQHGDDRSRS
jgi:hypothetical protein